MKNKDLIAALQQLDPEMEVCVFHDIGAMNVNDHIGIYRGLHEDTENVKAIWVQKEGEFIGIGNPANYEDDTNDYLMLGCFRDNDMTEDGLPLVFREVNQQFK